MHSKILLLWWHVNKQFFIRLGFWLTALPLRLRMKRKQMGNAKGRATQRESQKEIQKEAERQQQLCNGYLPVC